MFGCDGKLIRSKFPKVFRGAGLKTLAQGLQASGFGLRASVSVQKFSGPQALHQNNIRAPSSKTIGAPISAV